MSELKLIYVSPIGKNSNEQYEYEFFFSETPDIVWGENWEMQCPSICGDMKPDSSTYSEIKKLVTEIPFFCAQQNSCFSMQDCVDNIIALAWLEDLSIVFHFGEDIDEVYNKINENNNIKLL